MFSQFQNSSAMQTNTATENFNDGSQIAPSLGFGTFSTTDRQPQTNTFATSGGAPPSYTQKNTNTFNANNSVFGQSSFQSNKANPSAVFGHFGSGSPNTFSGFSQSNTNSAMKFNIADSSNAKSNFVFGISNPSTKTNSGLTSTFTPVSSTPTFTNPTFAVPINKFGAQGAPKSIFSFAKPGSSETLNQGSVFSPPGVGLITATTSGNTSNTSVFGSAITSTPSFQNPSFLKVTNAPSVSFNTNKPVSTNPFLIQPSTSPKTGIFKQASFTQAGTTEPSTVFNKDIDRSNPVFKMPRENKDEPNIDFSHKNVFSRRSDKPYNIDTYRKSSAPDEMRDKSQRHPSKGFPPGRLFSRAMESLYPKRLNIHNSSDSKNSKLVDFQNKDSKPKKDQEGKLKETVIPEVKLSFSKDVPASIKSETRTASVEEINNITMLLCKDIPKEYNNKFVLNQHFSRFGRIIRLTPNPRKRSATIRFANHESAENAKRNGKFLQPGNIPFDIFWMQPKPGHKAHLREFDSKQKEVLSELQALSETEQMSEEMKHLERPKEKLRSYSRHKQKSSQDVMLKNLTAANLVSKARLAVARQTSQTHESKERSCFDSKERKAELVTLWKNLKDKVALSSEDRYTVLETRDKILQHFLQREFKNPKAKTIVGTCPDMCPEKERYFRESRRQVSVFETLHNAEKDSKFKDYPMIDHASAVKEYSRSSADQPLPLPNELRPIPILKLTMDYLLNNIADKYEETKVQEWYDFLWNRTRAIRKDITQQQLTDSDCISLVEKCARFHIHCAAFLCEEETNVFDVKINNENLTKCLQSLKHFYDDLAQENIYSKSESEFRAYDVLLNINQGDILRQAQYFRPEVRESPQVQFALQVFSAVNSNNYVRFFKLVRSTTYLNACILHRYFTQVRGKALHIMLRAHCLGSHIVMFPLEDFSELLAFERIEEAKSFCQHYGFAVNNNRITFNRSSFVRPEVAFPLWRAGKLIGKKRTVSIGEVINGVPLPPTQHYTASSSFSEGGFFQEDFPPYLLDTFDEKAIKTSCSPSSIAVVPESSQSTDVSVNKLDNQATKAAETKLVIENAVVKDIARDMFLDVINEICNEVATSVMHYVNFVKKFSNEQLDMWIQDELRDICEVTLLDEQLMHQQKIEAEELAKSKELAINSLFEEVMEEVITSDCRNFAENQMRLVNAELFNQSQRRVSAVLSNEYLNDVCQEEIQNITREVYYSKVILRDRELAEKINKVKRRWCEKGFNYWKKIYMKHLRLWDSMLGFPSCPAFTTFAEQVEQFPIQENWYLPSIIPLSNLSLNDTIDLQLKNDLERKTKAWQPLNLASLVGKYLITSQRIKKISPILYWKLVISLPDMDSHNDEYLQWIKAKLKKGGSSNKNGDDQKMEILSLYTCDIPYAPEYLLKVCIRSVQGLLSEHQLIESEERFHLLGTNGVLYVLTNPSTENDMTDWWLENQLRLYQLLEVKPILPPLPLVILVADNTTFSEEEIIIHLGLAGLCDTELIDSFKIHFLSNILDSNTSLQLLSALQWLAEQFPVTPFLSGGFLKDKLEDTLNSYFFTPVYQNLSKRLEAEMPHQDPTVLIKLYNSVILHFFDAITDEKLMSLSWPVAEFTNYSNLELPPAYWNTPQLWQHFENLLQELLLPPYKRKEANVWSSDHHEDVWHYLEDVVEKGKEECIGLVSKINWLLSRAQQKEDPCSLNDDDSDAPSICVPWTDILDACINYLLSCFTYQDPFSKGCELRVFYHEDKMQQFHFPSSWIEAGRIESTEPMLDISHKSIKRKLPIASIHTQKSRANLMFLADGEMPVEYAAKQTCHRLNQSVSTEKRKSDMFLQKLEEWIASPSSSPTLVNDPLDCKLFNGSNNMQEQMEILQNDILDDKIANKKFEMKLNYFLQN